VAGEPEVSKDTHHAIDVVFHIAFVIRQVGVSMARPWSHEDLQVLCPADEPQPHLDWRNRGRWIDERPREQRSRSFAGTPNRLRNRAWRQ
jgi:hypothetical protein